MRHKKILLFAKFTSDFFNPLYLPFIAFIVLIYFSYLRLLPAAQIFYLLFFVFSFTTIIPKLGIFFYRKYIKMPSHQFGNKIYRYIPYLITIISYSILLYLLVKIRMPHSFIGIFVSALSIQIICVLITPFIKVSSHIAATSGFIGAIIIFSLIFRFNAVYWLVIATLLTGFIASCRLILRQHNLEQIFWSVIIGISCGFFGIAWT